MPTILRPISSASGPCTIPNGMTSARTPLKPTIMAPSPMRTHCRTAAEHHEIAHCHVAAQHHVVGEDHVAADVAVVSDMGAHHEKAAIADLGEAAVILGARVQRDAFSNIAIDADREPGGSAA